ncbi:unnamed protein product, partial [Meganyctiphanes norvegica]
MAKMIGSLIDSRVKASWRKLEEWQSTIYSMMVFGATMVVMFWASVFLYTSFYFTYMPQESITWPIHLQYKSCGDQPGICSFPNSLVSVTDPSRGSLLARGQKYRVVVDLEMPESPTNQKSGTDLNTMSGMFLIMMEMRSYTGDVLRKASRSSMLRYKSPLLQTMSTFIFAPFLIYGAHEEKQLVTAELFSQYEEDPVTPLSDVFIEIGSRNIEVYSAQLRIHATFAGLRHFMYYYPLTAAVFGIGVCMVFLSLIVLFSWYQFSMPIEQMKLGPGGHPNGHLSVEDISKEDFEKDAKEGTDDSRRTSSASETSYSPAQMETDTKDEESGWSSMFSRRPSSPIDDTRESNTSRRTSSHNVASYVARRKSSTNASGPSSRRSSTRNDDTAQESSKKRSPSFFESIVGAISPPENTKEDIQNITLEVPAVRSRHSSAGSAKGEPTSSRKSSWRSSWFDGEGDTGDADDEPKKENYASSKHSSRKSSMHKDETQEELLQQTEDSGSKDDTSTSKRSSWRSSWFGGDSDTADTDDKPESLEESENKEESYTSKRSSWFGGDSTVQGAEEDKSFTEDGSLKISANERKPSIIESMFGTSLTAEQAENSSRRSSTRDDIVDNAQQETSTLDDSNGDVSRERRPSFMESMMGMMLSPTDTSSRRSSTREEIDNVLDVPDSHSRRSSRGLTGGNIRRDSYNENDDNISSSRRSSRGPTKEDILDVPIIRASSRKSSTSSFRGDTGDSHSRRSSRGLTGDNIRHDSDNDIDDNISSSRRSSRGPAKEDILDVPVIRASSRKSSTSSFRGDTGESSGRHSTYLGDDLEVSTDVDHSSPTGSRRSSRLDDSLGNESRERRPSFIESMMGMMLSPPDTSSRRSSTKEEIDVLEVPDSNSRRSSRGSTRENIRRDSYNENDDNRSSSRRSSRGPTREDVLEVPIIKAGSRRSSTGSFRGDTSELSGRHSPRDVALEDAERLVEDANLVIRRRSSIKDSSIKRVSYLLDEDSNSSRRRSSTQQPLETEDSLYPADVPTRRKSSTSFIKHLLTESSDNDDAEIYKTSRSSSRDDRGEVVHRLSRSSSPVTRRVHEESNSEEQPRPVSGRLSYLFQESETDNLAVASGATAERRPSFIESMIGMLAGGGGQTEQNDSDNKEDETS